MGLVNNVNNEEVMDIDLSVIRKKRFRIDGDNNRILELNTSDMGIVNRLNEVYPKLQKLAEEAAVLIDTDSTEEPDVNTIENVSKTLKNIDKKMREYIDYLFDANVSEVCVVTGTMWDPYDGKFTFEHIIDKLGKLYENNFSKEFAQMSQRVKKYTDKYMGKKKK